MGEAAVRSTDWSSYRLATGAATGFGEVLIAMLRSQDDQQIQAVWRRVENAVFSQDDIYDAAEPTVQAMVVALIDERPTNVRNQILELIYFLLNGASVADPDLSRRCHEQALPGFWLVAREAACREGRGREAALELLELLDAHRAQTVRDWIHG